MKKIATAAVAATMALGLAVPTAGAAEDKGSSYDNAYVVSTVVSGNTCKITYPSGRTDTLTPAQAKQKIDPSTADLILMYHQAYLRGDSDATLYNFKKGEDLLALQACSNGENYTTNFANSLSSVVEPHEGRAAAYWLLKVIVPLGIGIAALGAAFSPEFRHMLPAPVAQFLTDLLK